MSIASASASSSSSQSRRLSWQPSQDANFHTASRGFFCGRAGRMSDLPFRQEPAQPVIAEHRAVAADKERPELAMAAKSHGAFHVAFQRQIYRLFRKPGVAQCRGCETHHDLGSADQGDRVRRIESGARDECRHDPDMAVPLPNRVIDRHRDVDIKPAPPVLDLAAEQDLAGAARPVEQRELTVAGTLREEPVDDRTQWRQAKSAGKDDDIASGHLIDRPAAAERPAQPDRLTGAKAYERARHRPDRADRMNEPR